MVGGASYVESPLAEAPGCNSGKKKNTEDPEWKVFGDSGYKRDW